MPHYRNKAYLLNAVERYRKFIHMKRQFPGEFLVPCYDFDLIWHSHQLHPLNYRNDTKRMLGKLFNHDDTVNDRSAGSKLCVSDAKTRELWRQLYQVLLIAILLRTLGHESYAYIIFVQKLSQWTRSKFSKEFFDKITQSYQQRTDYRVIRYREAGDRVIVI